MKAVEINSCLKCPHLKETPYPTSDSFERPSYWWCCHKDVKVVNETESTEDYRRGNDVLMKARKIQGYVEWHEERKIKIPGWCPLPNIE